MNDHLGAASAKIGPAAKDADRREGQARRRIESIKEGMRRSPGCAALFDGAGRILAASPAWERVRGLVGANYAGRAIQDVIPDLPPLVLDMHRRAARGEHLLNEAECFLDGSGRRRWFHCEYRPYFGLKGELGRYSVNAVDITPLVEARHEAQASSERLSLALGAAHAGVFEIDFLDERVWCSPEFEQIIGRAMSFDEITLRPWPNIHPDDRSRVAEALGVGRSGGIEVAPHEARVVLPSGECRWVDFRGAVHLTPSGEVSRIIGVALDIDERKRQELAHAQTRLIAEANAKRLELALDAAKVGVLEIDLVTRAAWFSPEVEEILGQAPIVDDLGAPPWPMCHPDDRDRLDRMLAGVTSTRLEPIDFRILRPSGEVRWIQIHSQMEQDAGGSPIKVVVLVVDIDASKQQELALADARLEAQANADRLSLALGAARAGVCEIDFRAKSVWCSPEFEDLIGRDVAFEDFRDGVWPMCHPDDREAFIHIVKTWTEPRHQPFDFRIILPTGKTLWVESHGEREMDSDGHPMRIVAIFLDIDARKRQELALADARREAQANAERLRLALDAAGAGVFETNFKQKTFWCSPQLTRVIGREMTYDEASVAWPMIHPDDVTSLDEMAGSAIATGMAHCLQLRIMLPSGDVRWIETHVETHGGVTGDPERAVGFILDIDERKRQELSLIAAEQAAQIATEAKSQFLANMSHEVRTPMNGVLGVLHLLTQEPLTKQGRELLKEAESCGRMLAQLLNDVVDFSKIEAGRLELSAEPMDAMETLKAVARLLRPAADAKGVELRTSFSGDDSWISADSVRLRQVLFNLIGNAVKFTSKGHVEVRLSIHRSDDGGKRLRIEVEDTGVGIPKAALTRLFQRFQQADGSTARRFGGSGLGLAITRALADLMGGEVNCSSVEGQGSIFCFDVPVETMTARPAEVVSVTHSLEGLNILVVEDNPTNQLVITRILESFGARVETADDGVDGLHAAQTGRYDLMLMDVQMPRMDGVEATRRIRALGAPAAKSPIIGLTANVLDYQRQEYLAAGMNGVVAKPISPAALLTEIVRVCGGGKASVAA